MAFGRKKSEDPDTSATAVSDVQPPPAEPAGETPLSAQAAANGAERTPRSSSERPSWEGLPSLRS